MIYAAFFQPPVARSPAALPNEIQQVSDELTALKTELIKNNSALEERLERLEEHLVRLKAEQKTQSSK